MTKPTQQCPACGETATYTCIPDSLGVICDYCGVISVCGKPTQWTICKWAEDLAERAAAKQKEQQ